jgi:hypothetical protein
MLTLNFIIIFTAYGALIGIGGIVANPYQSKYPTSTAGCNITDSSMLANLTSPMFDPIAFDGQPHYKFVSITYLFWKSIFGNVKSLVEMNMKK